MVGSWDEGKATTLPTIRAGVGGSVREAMRDAYPEPGSRIGGIYRVERTIGEGGMGVVLRAHDERLDRTVAIKLIHPDQVLIAKARARFLEEARAMARVRHPNVVEVYAFGELGETPYFVMEYVAGTDLERWLARRGERPTLGEAWSILDQACRGVAAIHASGATHRDLKASNLLIDPDFRVVVTDLGLARLLDEQGRENVVSGTPAYMAPELIQGLALTAERAPRTDVYSLGVLAFELLTGSLPFQGDTLSQTLGLQLTSPPPRLVERRPELPQAFEDAVLKALAKDPEARTPSVEQLRRELEAAWRQSGEATSAAPLFLVADDDPGLRSLMAKTLRTAYPDARVESVEDGERALALARSHAPALVVTDLDMPRMNGVELTAALRADERTAELPILVATAIGGPADWRVLSRLGADAMMLKPFDPAQLVGLAESLTGLTPAQRPKRRRRPSQP